MRLRGQGSLEDPAVGRRARRRPTPARGMRSNRALARRSAARGRPRRLALLLAVVAGFAAGLLVPRFADLPAGAPGLEAMIASVTGHRWLAPAEVARLTGIAAGTPLGQVEPAEVAERLAAHPWVATARVAVLAPGNLLLSVEERVPLARVRIDGVAYWVDREGVPFAPAGAPLNGVALPEVRGVTAQPGLASEDIAAAVALLERLAKRPIGSLRAIQIGAAPAEQLPIIEIEGFEAPIRVMLGANIPAALDRLEPLLAAGLGEVGRAREIDVRFGDQAILRATPLGETPSNASEMLSTGSATPGDDSEKGEKTDAVTRGHAAPRILGARG